MKLDGIDIEKTIASAEEALHSDESISLSLKAIFLILLVLIKLLVN